MSQTIIAHFDGRAIVPDEPVELAAGQRLRVQIDTIQDQDYPLTRIGGLATDMGVDDLADKHQTYARKQ
jgi:hypothetical protein